MAFRVCVLILFCLLSRATGTPNDPCAPTRNGIMGLRLGMTIGEVTRLLGRREVIYEHKDYLGQNRTAYKWTRKNVHIKVGFGNDGRAENILIAPKGKVRLIGALLFLQDSYNQVVREFGVPTVDPEPLFGEYEYVYYEYGYSCSGEQAYEVTFLVEFRCQNIDFAVCGDRTFLRKIPIGQVEIRLPKRDDP